MSIQHAPSTPMGLARDDTQDPHAVWAVVGGTVGMALGFGCLALTSVFMQPLEQAFGWSRADVSLGYAMAAAGMAVGGLIWGRLSDRLDIRLLLTIGGAGMVLSLLGMAAAQSLWHFYAANLVLGGFGFAVLYAPLVSAPGEWFVRNRGLAIGIVTAGGAAGPGILPYVASILIRDVGWRQAFLYLSIAVLVALLLTFPRLRRPDSVGVVAGAVVASEPLSAGERRGLAILAVAAFMCCTCMGVPLVHLASFVGGLCGSPELGAASLLIAMLSGAVGRVCFGAIADRIGYVPSYALASVIQTGCVLAYPLLGDAASLLTLSAVFGFGFSGNMTCLILCVRETVAANRFGSALGMVMLIAWAGMAAGGYAGGLLFDLFASYALAFVLAGAAGGLNLMALLALARQRRGLRTALAA
ncbi:MAG: MFS transporter [Hyphomicrobiaceae bacterium]